MPNVMRCALVLDSNGFTVTFVGNAGSLRNILHNAETWQLSTNVLDNPEGWAELQERLVTARKAIAAPRAEMTLIAPRPVMQTKTLQLARISVEDARRMIAQSSDMFFPRNGASVASAAIRNNRSSLAVAVASTELLQTANDAVTAAGFRFHGMASAAPCTAFGVLALSPQLRTGEWRLLLPFSQSAEIVEMVNSRFTRMQSVRLETDQEDANAVIDSTLPVLQEPHAKMRIWCVAPARDAAIMHDALERSEIPVARSDYEEVDLAALAAVGVFQSARRIPHIITDARRRDLTRAKRRSVFALIALLCLMPFCAAAGYGAHLHRRLARIEQERAAHKNDVARALRSDLAIRTIDARADAVSHLHGNVGSIVARIAHLTDLLPDDAYLVSMHVDSETMRLDGRAASAAALLPVFEAQPWVKSVKLGGSIRRERNGDGVLDHFSLTLQLRRER